MMIKYDKFWFVIEKYLSEMEMLLILRLIGKI